MIERFQTGRLEAERLRADHLGVLDGMHRDPRVMATLGGLRTGAQTRAFLRENLDHWDRHGFGLWVFRDRGDGRFVGRAGLRHVAIVGRDEVELAYALRAESWGRGLATEMARALVALGCGPLGLDEVIALTLPSNLASRRVMEKAGLAFEREIVHAGLPHVLARIVAAPGRGGRSGGRWRPAMPVHIRVDGGVVVLSHFGALMNDPRHFDAARDVQELLDQGHRRFVLELRGVGELGPGGIGLLVTITRLVRRHDGEVVLARPGRGLRRILEEMRLDAYWEVCEGVEEAKALLDQGPA
jgi:[ribosomal protein S5]-alanine N-acetyltransferase